MFSDKPKIFVQIASYRDTELQHTVSDLFAKAKYPERIFIGICNQIDIEADKDCFEVVYPRPEQVKEIIVPAIESKGVCWARHKIQELYHSEEYVLMIDSHMRFLQDWDELFIDELKLCPSEKAVISNYPAGYTAPNNLQPIEKAIVMVAKPFNPQGNLRFTTRVLISPTEKPLKGAFIAAGFLFTSGRMIREIPYDPYMYFGQEEISISARLYTHGWDVYSPRKNLIYHMYLRHDASKKRRLHWEDNKDWSKMSKTGSQRFAYLLGEKKDIEHEHLKDIEKYGLGNVRSLKQFEEYCGINFSKREVTEKALKGLFIEDIEKYLPAEKLVPMKNMRHAHIGEIIPMFTLPDHEGKNLSINYYAGFKTVLFFLPTESSAYVKDLFEYIKENDERIRLMDFHRIYIVKCSVFEAAKIRERYNIMAPFWVDEIGDLCDLFGISHTINKKPLSVVLDKQLKMDSRFDSNNALNNIADVLRSVKAIDSKK